MTRQALQLVQEQLTALRSEMLGVESQFQAELASKGRHILTAVRALDDILTRMQAHQLKKSAMLKRLGLADRFFRPPPA